MCLPHIKPIKSWSAPKRYIKNKKNLKITNNTKIIISNLETGTPEVPESKIPFLIGENSFIDMDVRAVNRKGNKIKLIPGNAKYPSEEKFEKIGKGMMTKDFPLI